MSAASVRVVAAYGSNGGKTRVVFEDDDGRIGLAEGRIDRGEEGRALFDPQGLAEIRRYAELVVAGNATAISHPKGMMVLAAGLVAVLEAVSGGADDGQSDEHHG